MPVAIALFRGINMARHHRIRMEPLRAMFESLSGVRDPQTLLQSGNVVFRTGARDLDALGRRIEKAFESCFAFRSPLVLRSADELREAAARNPFASRPGIEPAKLAITFLATDPGAAARKTLCAMPIGPEEMHVERRELYIYFPNGMGRSKFPMAAIERAVNTATTSRNWNTLLKLLAMAEEM